MARFNFSPVPEIAPTGAPGNDYERIPTSPAMFGGAVAGAEEKLGQGVESVGQAGLSYLQTKQELDNEVHSNEKLSWDANQRLDKFQKFRQLEGNAAQQAWPQFQQDMADQTKATLDGESPRVSAMLSRGIATNSDRYLLYASEHASTQSRQWHDKVATDSASTWRGQAVVDAQHGTWDHVDQSLHASDEQIETLWRQKTGGGGDAQTEAAITHEVQKNRGAAVLDIVRTLSANGDPTTAQAVLDRYAKANKYGPGMDAASIAAATGHLAGLTADLTGHAVVQEETGLATRGGATVDTAITQAAAATGLDPTMLRRFARIESGGDPNARTGSYRGLFQLSDAEFKQYGGGDINNPRDNAMAAARKLSAESHEFEQQHGRPPTPAELYMIHQQGAAGFAAHMANPDAPAWQNMAATAEGRQKGEAWAKQAIWGNLPDSAKRAFGSVENVTSRQFVGVWQGRYGNEAGGALPDRQETFNRILARTEGNPRAQAAAISRFNQIYANERAEQTQNRVLFDQRERDEKAEAFDTGALSTKTPLNESDYISRYGPLEGPEKYREHADDIDMGAKVAAAASMTPQQRADLVPQPQPGPGYARAVARRAEFDTAMARLDRQRKEDPAGLALRRLPDVTAAYQGMGKVESDPQSTDDQKRIARANFAAVMRDEQARIAIAPEDRRLLPKAAIDDINARFTAAAASEDPQARAGLIASVQHEAKLWGPQNWPDIARQLAPQVQPIVKAIADEADPVALSRLLRVDPKENPARILKEQDDVKARGLETELNKAFAPFNATLLPAQRDGDGLAYRGLAETLAALYVRDGMGAPQAADKAVADLVGVQYDFRGSLRIPKSIHVDPDEIAAGSYVARGHLAELGAVPPRDDLPGRTNAAADDLAAVGRDGIWITAPDHSGASLYYAGKSVKGADGKPLVVPWTEFQARARAQADASQSFVGGAL